MERGRAPRGVYVITPDWSDTRKLESAVAAAIAGGANAIQYRNKSASASLRHEQAAALVRLTHSAGLAFFVDDDAALALTVGADGVHIGATDGDPVAVHAKLPRTMMLGVSCYADLELVTRALSAGAAYVALGAMFPSKTKPGAATAGIEKLRQARSLGAHMVASGGVSRANIASIAAAGAHAAGVVSAVFDADEPQRATAELVARFAEGVPKT